MANELIPIESQGLAQEALDYCSTVTVVEIQNNSQAEAAARFFRELGGYVKKLDDEREKVKRPHLEAGRTVDAFFKEKMKALENLHGKLRVAIQTYDKVLADKRREEQERLNREAEDRRRREEEAARKEREKADLYRQQGREKLAEKAQFRADLAERSAERIVAPIAQVATPVIDGLSKRANWKMEINDHLIFVQWAVQNQQHFLLMPNPATCSSHAKTVRREIVYEWGRIWNDETINSKGLFK